MKFADSAAISAAHKAWKEYLRLMGQGRAPFEIRNVDPAACTAAGCGPEHYRVTEGSVRADEPREHRPANQPGAD